MKLDNLIQHGWYRIYNANRAIACIDSQCEIYIIKTLMRAGYSHEWILRPWAIKYYIKDDQLISPDDLFLHIVEHMQRGKFDLREVISDEAFFLYLRCFSSKVIRKVPREIYKQLPSALPGSY